jgi:adenylate cyclase
MAGMPRNIELKARIDSLAAAVETARQLADADLGIERQRDTYFRCASGRLKLREIAGKPAVLIAYHRADQQAAKASDYLLVEVPRPAELREALSAALGIEVVVEKERRIFRWRNVRIHLDQVTSLGEFLEFEAVLDDRINDADGVEQLAWLGRQFAVKSEQLVAGSYRDLLQRA